MQKISFKSHYIIPTIKSRKDINDIGKNFIDTAKILTDKSPKNNVIYTKKGLLLKIIDKFDINFENIARFYNCKFLKK